MTARLDRHERQIILLLQQDGRMSHVDIANAIGVTEATVRRKLHRLIDDGIIKLAAVANPFAIGFTVPAIVGLKVEPAKVVEIAETLARMPVVRYVAITTGNYDIIVEGYFRGNEELSRFLLEDLRKVDGIVDTQTSLLLRLVKQSYDWGVPAEPEGGENGGNADAGKRG